MVTTGGSTISSTTMASFSGALAIPWQSVTTSSSWYWPGQSNLVSNAEPAAVAGAGSHPPLTAATDQAHEATPSPGSASLLAEPSKVSLRWVVNGSAGTPMRATGEVPARQAPSRQKASGGQSASAAHVRARSGPQAETRRTAAHPTRKARARGKGRIPSPFHRPR